MPRMNAAFVLPYAALASNIVTLGAALDTSTREVILRSARALAVRAVIASGVCCNLSDRYSAVTTISSRAPVLGSLAAPGVAVTLWACAAPAARARPTHAASDVSRRL